MFKANNDVVLMPLQLTWNIFHTFFYVSIADLDNVFVCWVNVGARSENANKRLSEKCEEDAYGGIYQQKNILSKLKKSSQKEQKSFENLMLQLKFMQ